MQPSTPSTRSLIRRTRIALRTAPRAIPASDPARPSLIRAANTAAALAIVAEHIGAPAAELARTLTRRNLETELARIIVKSARAEARRLFHEPGAEPPAGADVYARIVRRDLAALQAAEDERLEAEADRRLNALLDT